MKFKKFNLLSVLLLSLVLALSGCSDNNTKEPDNNVQVEVDKEVEEETPSNTPEEEISNDDPEPVEEESSVVNEDTLFDGYRLIEVDGGNLSGHREPNVVVDIGFGDREYWAFTNEYGQLVKVVAKEIILQDEENEPVTSKGRYYRDEAKVPGVERPDLDEGHIIADSLGGVSNAYNITPQESTLNRHGDQAYMEHNIREAGGCTDFTAIITYPDTKTQIPSHYSYTYTLKGNVIHDEFDNINPDNTYGDNSSATSSSSGNTSTSANYGVESTYILNTNTKKYHLPTCNSVKSMKDKNKKEVNDTPENLEKQGYEPCKNCIK